jgi:hypothetical protein
MQTGLHAVTWTVQRLAVAIVGVALLAMFAYVGLVFVMVAVQAVASFGQ